MMLHLLRGVLLPPLVDKSLHVALVAPRGNLSFEEGLKLRAQESPLFGQELHLFLGVFPTLENLGVLLLQRLKLPLEIRVFCGLRFLSDRRLFGRFLRFH